MTDPEDAKSLDSNEGVAALTEERSDNNSSNSDIVHVEREEAELMEGAAEEAELQDSMMSVLGTESELAELRAEFREAAPDTGPPASLASLEGPVVVEAPPVGELAAQPAVPAPVPAVEPDPVPVATAKEEPPAPAGPVAVEVEAAKPAEPVPVAEPGPTPVAAEPPQAQEPQEAAAPAGCVAELGGATLLAAPPVGAPEEPATPTVEPPTAVEPGAETELPVLLYGGAALVALAGLLAYAVLTYRKK